MEAQLRPVVLPPELIGKRAPCALFNARGVLLVKADAVIAFSARSPLRPTRVFCPVDQAARISDLNPIARLAPIGNDVAQLAERLARGEAAAAADLGRLAQSVHELWSLDADACLGYARLCRFARPSICHLIHVALLAAELAAASRLDRARIAGVIGGALAMNIARLELHDRMYESAEPPSSEQLAEIRAHPQDGARLLARLGSDVDPGCLEAVASHHENIDGSGYPRALKGAGIALPARMLRVADTFAARLVGRKTRQPLHWNLRRTHSTRSLVQHVFGGDQQRLDPSLMSQLVEALGPFPPGSLVRLDSGEVAVVARRIPGELASPREVLSVRDSFGRILPVPRRRRVGYRGCAIRGQIPPAKPVA